MKHPLKSILIFFICFIHSTVFSQSSKKIKVHCQGQGQPVYLIGGGPAFTTWNLQPIQNHLSKNHKVCRWDMRGVGDNAGLPIEAKKSALSQWIADMDKVLPQQPVILWGHSWGALQVLMFAKKHPERVNKMILNNPVDPSLLSMENIERKLFSHPEVDSRLMLDDIDTPAELCHNFKSKIASYFSDAKQGWEYASRFNFQDTNNRLNVRIWEEYKKNPLTDKDIKHLEVKIAGLIHCKDDVLQPESMFEYRRLLTKPKHYVLNDCTHFPWEENPNEYFRLLSRLLGES